MTQILTYELSSSKSVKFLDGNLGFMLFFSVIVFLGYLNNAVSEEISMVSLPLGSIVHCPENKILVSESSDFALGFLNDYQKDADGFVVGVYHNFIQNGIEKIAVWTVGGAGVRVSENSSFELSLDGSLVLFSNNILVWSSNTANLGVKYATLLDNGNLVLVGFGGKYIWQSFDYPTDTLLPDQSFHYPQTLQASSPNSVASYYSLKMKSFGEIYLVWDDNVTYWSSPLSLNSIVDEVRFEADGRLGLFDFKGNASWFVLSEDFKDPFVQYRRLRIDEDGNLRIYSWRNTSSSWKVVWQAVQSQCNVFGSCGLYSVCSYDSNGPTCGCLNSNSKPNACERMTDLANCERGVSMVVLKQTVLYSLYPPHDIEIMLSMEACKQYCLNDTSCYAATAKNDGSGICTVKKTSFISGFSYSSTQSISFMKVCLVPEAVSAQAANLGANGSPPSSQQKTITEIVGNSKSYKVAIVGLLLITGSVFLVVEMVVFWLVIYKRRQSRTLKLNRNKFGKDIAMNPHYSALVRLSIEEVQALTKNFGNKLGPSIYKGILANKIMVIVKVLNDVVASEREFQLVVSNLGSTHHRNLVALKGFCYDPKHKLILYEHINNGSLDTWLVDKKSKCKGWHQRINIAIGVARALAYLHLQCKQCIAHGNLKLENVLLDEDLNPKLSDFGLHGLLKKNDAASSSESLPERDVYMFGVLLLQIFLGKKQGFEKECCDLAYQLCESEDFDGAVDFKLEGRVEVEGIHRVVKLALWCMQDNTVHRPSISEVVRILEGALSLDMPPRT